MKCRHCHTELVLPFIDLDTAPPSNSYLSKEQLLGPEKWFPLRVLTCTNCWLVQTEDFTHFEDLFSVDYAYFSSYSTSWLTHAEKYVAYIAKRFDLGPDSQVIEVAANDGYLLQYVQRLGIRCLGIEPTRSTADAARKKGIEIVESFFGVALAEELRAKGLDADVIVANNVLAHVPDINDFVSGFARLMKPQGIATFEFPYVMELVSKCQFDTIYHEHFSYLSLTAVRAVFEQAGLLIFDVHRIGTHGGSVRVFAQRRDVGRHAILPSVGVLLATEKTAGIQSEAYYTGFQRRAEAIRDDLMSFLINAKRSGHSVGAYGAAAKGNTLLNYCGIRASLIPWVVDRNPAKLGKFLPGSRISIVSEDYLRDQQPHYVVIFPWNLQAEIMAQLSYIREWGGQFVTAIPEIIVQ